MKTETALAQVLAAQGDRNDYEPHLCRNTPGPSGPGSWDDPTQDKLDAAMTLAQLRRAWIPLENRGEVDMMGGAEWRHALSHLAYRLGARPPAGLARRQDRYAGEDVAAELAIAAGLARAGRKAGLNLPAGWPGRLPFQFASLDDMEAWLHGELDLSPRAVRPGDPEAG